MLNNTNKNLFSILFTENKIVNYRNVDEKNISEPLLTIRTLILIDALADAQTLRGEMYLQIDPKGISRKIATLCTITP